MHVLYLFTLRTVKGTNLDEKRKTEFQVNHSQQTTVVISRPRHVRMNQPKFPSLATTHSRPMYRWAKVFNAASLSRHYRKGHPLNLKPRKRL